MRIQRAYQVRIPFTYNGCPYRRVCTVQASSSDRAVDAVISKIYRDKLQWTSDRVEIQHDRIEVKPV